MRATHSPSGHLNIVIGPIVLMTRHPREHSNSHKSGDAPSDAGKIRVGDKTSSK